MCIIPFWLVDWETTGWPLGGCWLAALGGCWLAPGKAGWPLGRLTGPWEGCYWWLCWEAAGWPLGRLLGVLICWICWFSLIFDAAAWWWKLKADADFSVALATWLEMVVRHYKMFKNQPVTRSTQTRLTQWWMRFVKYLLENTGFDQFKCNFVDIYIYSTRFSMTFPYCLQATGHVFNVFLGIVNGSQFWAGSTLIGV